MTNRIRWNKWAPRYVADYMKDFGLPKEFACAFPGNFARESGYFNSLQEVNPLVKGSAGGLGHGQWTGPRRRAFEAWLKRKGYAVDSYEGNYSYSFRELAGHEPQFKYLTKVIDRLKGATSLENAVWIVGKYYEGPAHLNLDERIVSAREALALYNANPVPATVWPEEVKMPDEKIITTTAEPAKPVLESKVMQGALGGVVLAFYGLSQTYNPALGVKQEMPFWVAFGGLLTALWTVYGRVSSNAQPLTWTRAAADEEAAKRTVAEVPAEVQQVMTNVPVVTPPLKSKPLDELVDELPEAMDLLVKVAGRLFPQVGLLKDVLDAVQQQRPLQLPPRGREGEKL